MSFFKKKEQPQDEYRAAAYRRLSRLTTKEVLDWADQVGSAFAKALDDYRNSETYESLVEAENASIALDVIVDLLISRETEQR